LDAAMRTLSLIFLIFLLFPLALSAKPFDIEEMIRLKRVSDPQVSPNGQQVLFGLRETDIEGNRGYSPLWLLTGTDGNGKLRRLTQDKQSASQGRFSADGQSIYFLSTRSGSNQIWRLPLDGGEALQVSALPLDVGSFDVSPDGKKLVFSLEVFLDCADDLACSKKRIDALAARKDSGTLHDKLFIRHWDTWADGRRAQLFSADLGANGLDNLHWLSRGLDGDVPSKPDGDESEYSISPDAQQVIFSLRVAGKSEAWSTNFDLYSAPLDGSKQPNNLTAANLAWDTSPLFSRDGAKLYYKAMSRPGFEADRFRIVERNLKSGAEREVAPAWDHSPDHFLLAQDGKTLFANALVVGHRALWAIDVASGKASALDRAGNVAAFALGNEQLVYLRDDLDSPADIYQVAIRGGKATRLTQVNAEQLKNIEFGSYEQFSFPGWNEQKVYGWVVKPVGFKAGQQYPVAFIVHGGPQSSFGNVWSYRWNPQTYAGQRFAVVFIDFHGSTGYGQAFTDSISQDWGGKPLEDLQKGLEHARASYPFLSPNKACAMGASYGGYMVNWIAGAWPDGFQCIVSHAGILDNRFMGLSTEELWFSEWENGGTVFDQAQNYERANPVNLISKWRTPMLVTHGMLDFRVPFEQGIAVFTALQRRGIDSQFLHFPDENHWILKPANSVLWHRTVEAWLKQYTR